MNQYLDDDGSSHLLLAVNRMMKYQDLVKSMRDRITALEHENKDLKQSFENQLQVSAKEVGNLGTKFNRSSKALAALEANSKNDVKS